MSLVRAGYVNPLQHMREPNENVIQMARAKVRESVVALEALLEWKSVIRLPVDACFGLIDIEHGLVSCDWSCAQVYSLVECLARVSISLSVHRFLIASISVRSPTISVRCTSTSRTMSVLTRCFVAFMRLDISSSRCPTSRRWTDI